MGMFTDAHQKSGRLLPSEIHVHSGHPLRPVQELIQPDADTITEWLSEGGGCEATDGCWVEQDGTCPHGHPSWLLYLGMI